MRHSRVVALCPARTVTGGPEALHQFVDSINRQGGNGAICYQPNTTEIPSAYHEYDTPVITREQITDDDLVVIPEIWPQQVGEFKNAALWWLSVDWAKPEALTCQPLYHLAQSFYAYSFLLSHNKRPTVLADYIHPAFVDRRGHRDPVVAVNPAKGKHLIEQFREVAPDIELLELAGYDRNGLVDVLNRTTVYVDFGHHPGRDRLPREAAVCGNVVFVHDVGAGRCHADYAVGGNYRFRADDLDTLARNVRHVLENRNTHFATQSQFRKNIADERQLFDDLVRGLLW
jgi:hypothetical protein